MKFQLTPLSLLISGLFLATGAQAQTTTDVGTISVQGTTGTDTGLITPEDSPKARSSVNRDFIDKQGIVNPYQLINLLPGVNSFGYDSTGLFGGNIRVRGFNSDQIGLTINGAPVNDSGNFALFPQEYTDAENTCSVFVTQGATDTDAPHVGASGGNIGIQSCAPKDQLGGLVDTSIGSDSYRRTFLRADTGLLFNGLAKFFVSQSHAEADKFRGQGGAKRDHTEFGARLDFGKGSFIDANYLYNRAVNNNYRALTKADINAEGYYTDFNTIAPVHQPGVAGTAQNDATYAPNVSHSIFNNAPGTNSADGYYGYQLNPFRNFIASANAHWQIAPTMNFEFRPYMWYGYGTGGNELQTAVETSGGNRIHGGVLDANGDGDRLDTVAYYNGSTTKTYRPGFTSAFNLDLYQNHIQLGYWYEKTRHQQQAPYLPIDSAGNVSDLWERTDSQFLRQQDGQPLEFRDWYTINTVKAPSIQDSISLFDDRLVVVAGVKHESYDREFTNSANIGTAAAADYRIERNYAKTLPSLGATFHFTPEQSVFVSGTKNQRAPNNTALSGLVTGGTIVNGVDQNFRIRDPEVIAEYSYNYDVGYRLATDKYTFSGSVFYVNYNHRIATAYDPNLGISTDYNVGHSTSKGAELEGQYKITNEISLYSSASYIRSKLDQDYPFSATVSLPTTGKTFPGTPKWLGAVNLQYATGPFYAFAQAKYTGKVYSTLVNDDDISGYTIVNLGTGYTLPSTWLFKSPTIRGNLFNVLNRKYLSVSSGSGNSFRLNSVPIVTTGGTKAAEIPTFYVGSPITFQVTLSTAF